MRKSSVLPLAVATILLAGSASASFITNTTTGAGATLLSPAGNSGTLTDMCDVSFQLNSSYTSGTLSWNNTDRVFETQTDAIVGTAAIRYSSVAPTNGTAKTNVRFVVLPMSVDATRTNTGFTFQLNPTRAGLAYVSGGYDVSTGVNAQFEWTGTGVTTVTNNTPTATTAPTIPVNTRYFVDIASDDVHYLTGSIGLKLSAPTTTWQPNANQQYKTNVAIGCVYS